MNVLVTGAAGFIGRHIVDKLKRRPEIQRVIEFTRASTAPSLEAALLEADIIYHLAGVNRPVDPTEFQRGNTGLTEEICDTLKRLGRSPLIVFSSSRQASEENPYGRSKRGAEVALERWVNTTGGRACVFRLKNVFGKWCRPNYNSVTATFCYNIAHGLPVTISDPARGLELIYVDDVVESMLGCLPPGSVSGYELREVDRSYQVTLGGLAERIRGFKASRSTLLSPRSDDEFARLLYVTYLSYLEGADFSYSLQQRSDPRGTLAEFIKSPTFGQIFVSRTHPGVTRGNHFHHSKTEKFLVLEGEAIVRFRQVDGSEIIEHRVNGRDFRVVDIPPGYTHSIENIGTNELVTLFWANEIFDPQKPDTTMLPVIAEGHRC